MVTGELKTKVDAIWDAFWSGGIANPLEVMEQITYLLFIRRLDDLQTAKENRANRTGESIKEPVFPAGNDSAGAPYSELRWSRFKDREPGEMHALVADRVFPFLRGLGGDDSTYSHHMRDARFTIPTPALLARVVDMLDGMPMEGRDTKGDVYEYMLSKIATAGQNGQFRTPRHIIELMVEMTAPQPNDEICDPACGTAGFLVASGEYLRERHSSVMTDTGQREHFHRSMFHGYDFDSTMLRIGSMNMLLHGVEGPDIRYRDSLSEGASGDEGAYSLVLANPRGQPGLRVDVEGSAAGRQDQEDRTALPRPVLEVAQTRWARRRDRAGRRAVRIQQGTQGVTPDSGRGSETRRGHEAAVGRVPAIRGCVDGGPVLHQDQQRWDRPGVVLRHPG